MMLKKFVKSLKDLSIKSGDGSDLSTHRSAHDSGGDILGGGAIILEVTIRCGCDQLGEPKIGDLRIEIVVEENVACFDVPVEDGGVRPRVEV